MLYVDIKSVVNNLLY